MFGPRKIWQPWCQVLGQWNSKSPEIDAPDSAGQFVPNGKFFFLFAFSFDNGEETVWVRATVIDLLLKTRVTRMG
jgi:hypothetical protein